MTKALFGVAAAVAFATVAYSGTAKAECVWTGFNWTCGPPVVGYTAPYYPPYYGSTYPSYNHPDWGWGYKPNWVPSFPGARPSSGAGH